MATPASAQSDLTPRELRALSAGQLVTRPVVRRHGDLELMGGTSYQVIDRRPEAVWRALLATRHYPQMLPQVAAARTVARSPRRRTVYFRQGRGPVQVAYYLELTIDKQRKEIAFRLDEQRPHGLRAAWGLYSLHAYPRGRTLLVYGIMADIGSGLLKSLVRDTVHEWMLRVPWTIKAFLEGSGRELYREQGKARDASVARAALAEPP